VNEFDARDEPFPWRFTFLSLAAVAAASAAAWMLVWNPSQRLSAKLELEERQTNFFLRSLGESEARLESTRKELQYVNERRMSERRALEECILRENKRDASSK
jgi:hypothetical protein